MNRLLGALAFLAMIGGGYLMGGAEFAGGAMYIVGVLLLMWVATEAD